MSGEDGPWLSKKPIATRGEYSKWDRLRLKPTSCVSYVIWPGCLWDSPVFRSTSSATSSSMPCLAASSWHGTP